jgi:hypothetical protein
MIRDQSILGSLMEKLGLKKYGAMKAGPNLGQTATHRVLFWAMVYLSACVLVPIFILFMFVPFWWSIGIMLAWGLIFGIIFELC